jgi:hypothetical protein
MPRLNVDFGSVKSSADKFLCKLSGDGKISYIYEIEKLVTVLNRVLQGLTCLCGINSRNARSGYQNWFS